MNIKPRSRIRNKISHLLLKARKRVENEIREDFEKSGESYLIHSIAEEYAGEKITVFDVGANIGSWSTLLAREVSKHKSVLDLHAFEPDADYHGPGEFIKAAVSSTPGTVQIYKRKDSDQSSLYERRLAHSKQGDAKILEIPAIRLDDYIKKNNLQHIDLLKIDVEGHELSVLKSLGSYLRPSFVTYIQF